MPAAASAYAHSLVERGTPGFEVVRTEPMLGVRASQLAMLRFSDCEVAPEWVLGAEGDRMPSRDAFTGAQGAWDFMRPVLSSVIAGTCRAMMDEIERLVAGDGAHWLRRHSPADVERQLAHWRRQIEAGRLLYQRAAWKYDNRLPMSLDASMAKSYVARLAMSIAEGAVALFGPEILRVGSLLEKWYRDVKVFDILEGTGDMHKLMIAKIHGAPSRNLGGLVRQVAQRTAALDQA